MEDEEHSREPGRSEAPAAAPEQPVEKHNGEAEKGQMHDVEGQRIQAERIKLRGAHRHRQGAIIGPTGFLLHPPDMGDMAGPVEAIATGKVAEPVLAAQFEMIVIVEPETERQTVTVQGPNAQDQDERRQEVRAACGVMSSRPKR